MKTKNFPFFLASLLVFSACEKEVLTKPVEFTTTEYQNLGAVDPTGKPNYLVTPDEVSTGLSNFITGTLPEKIDLRSSNPELLTTKAIADIALTKQSDIYITFVSQGTANTNAVAYYTYPTTTPPAAAKDIKTITYIFPNAGFKTPLRKGDKVKLGTFEPGTSVGFVLLQNSWDTTARRSNNQVVHFCSNDALNPEIAPELKKHAVLVSYPSESKVLIGFEDVDRTDKKCDHDFNDVVVYATVLPK